MQIGHGDGCDARRNRNLEVNIRLVVLGGATRFGRQAAPQVRLRDMETKETETFALVYPNEANIAEGKLSILAPLGTAILSNRVGDVVRWRVPSGVGRWRVRTRKCCSMILAAHSMSGSSASFRDPSPIKLTNSAVTLIEQFRVRHTIGWLVSATTISLIIAAIVIPWGAFWVALPLGVLFVLLLTVPVYLAIVSGAGDGQTG